MYRQLWERETDTFLIEYRINGLVHIEVNSPIISTLYPNTDNNIYTACIQSMKGYKRCRVSKDTLKFPNKPPNILFHLIIVHTIFNANSPSPTAGIFTTIIGHCTTAQGSVRYINHFIISRSQNRMEDLYLTYRT